jgi:DNA-binding NtrC family response regulator
VSSSASLAAWVGLFLSGNNDENFYRNNNNNNTSSADDAIISQQDAGNPYNNTTNDGDKPLARLLIVDDDPDIVHVLKRGLQQNGFLADGFTNPKQALQSFKSNVETYSLVLSDARMPGLSGIQLTRKVKEINPHVKVVLMTAFEIRDNEFSKVLPSMQVDGFVQKPVGIRDLTNKILSLIGQSKRRRRNEDFDR